MSTYAGELDLSSPSWKPRVTFNHYISFIILLLPERKFLNIIPAVAETSAATFIDLG
jgi:hypothetical protein